MKGWQPGTKKTVSNINYLEEEAEKPEPFRDLSVILCQEHKNAKEYEGIEGVQVLKRFEDACQKFHVDPDIPVLYDKGNGVAPRWICRYKIHNGECSAEDCEYKKQFTALREDMSIVTTPHLLHILNLWKYKNLVIEENFIGEKKIKWHNLKNEIQKLKHTYEKNGFINLWEELNEKSQKIEYIEGIEYIKGIEYDEFLYHSDILKDIIEEYNKSTVKTCKNIKDLKKKLCSLYVNDIETYLKYNRTSEIPWEFVIFDCMFLRPDLNVTHLSSTFQQHRFERTVKKWERIIGTAKVNYTIEKSHLKGGIIHICPTLLCQKNRFKKLMPEIKKTLKKIDDKYKKRDRKHGTVTKILVITYLDQIEENAFLGYDGIHFGANHGTNQYEHYDVVVVIGTYLPDEKSLKELFSKYYPDVDINGVDFSPKTREYSYGYKDERVHQIYMEHWEMNEYDTINRIRPLQYQNKDIYILGRLPSQMVKEGYKINEYSASKRKR